MAGTPTHHPVGLRRVAWVRLSLHGDAAVAEAYGISHRLPRVHRVSISAARELVRQGVPLVVRHGRAGGTAGPATPAGSAVTTAV